MTAPAEVPTMRSRAPRIPTRSFLQGGENPDVEGMTGGSTSAEDETDTCHLLHHVHALTPGDPASFWRRRGARADDQRH